MGSRSREEICEYAGNSLDDSERNEALHESYDSQPDKENLNIEDLQIDDKQYNIAVKESSKIIIYGMIEGSSITGKIHT